MTTRPRTAFIVPLPSTPAQWTGFLDMLRYEQCTVHDYRSDLIVLATQPGQPPITGRWASFGLHILAATPLDTSGVYSASLVDMARTRLPAPRHVPR